MIIIINDDAAYLSWMQRHRDGFVLATRRKATRRNTLLHRATCPEIRSSKSKRTHWTTGQRVKACSPDLRELQEWALEETGAEAKACEQCVPHVQLTTEQLAQHAGPNGQARLTKQGREILAYVVETAIISLDNGTAYDVTVADVAQMLSKTPAEITSALIRLIEGGYVTMTGTIAPGKPLAGRRLVYPTGDGLRTEPAFANMSSRELAEELEQLGSDDTA